MSCLRPDTHMPTATPPPATTMRVFATATAVLAMATGSSALSKKVTTIAPFTDPTVKAQPAGLPSGYAVRDGWKARGWTRGVHGTRGQSKDEGII